MNDIARDNDFTIGRQICIILLSYQIILALWLQFYYTLFKCSLRPMNAWCNGLLRLYGAKIGRGVGVQRSDRIEFPWNLDFGAHMPVVRGVWLGVEVFVGSGVEVGENAVNGARAVVVKNMPTATVCAENPCRPINP